MTCGIQTAERLVDSHSISELGVVSEEGEHVVVLAAQDVFDEAVEGLLGPDLDENARARGIQRLQALDELDGRRDLLAGEVEHGLGRGVRGIELAGDVGDDRKHRGPHVEATQRVAERHRCFRDDRRVEGVAHGDPDGVHAHGEEGLDDLLDRLGGAANDRLGVRVDVGDDDIALSCRDDLFDLRERPEDRRHGAVVLHRDARHLAATRAHSLHGRVEREGTGGNERAVLTEAVTHHHVRLDPVCREQASE